MSDRRWTDGRQGDGFEPEPQQYLGREEGPYDEYEAYGEGYENHDGGDAYGEPFDPSYPPYEQPQNQGYGGYDEPPVQKRPQRPRKQYAVISTNATINLTCMVASVSGVLGLFFYFADKRSAAVRRTAVQSAALLITFCFMAALLMIFGGLLGSIPFVGGLFRGLAWVLLAAALIGCCVARWHLAYYAYSGQAYIIPLIGKRARQFE